MPWLAVPFSGSLQHQNETQRLFSLCKDQPVQSLDPPKLSQNALQAHAEPAAFGDTQCRALPPFVHRQVEKCEINEFFFCGMVGGNMGAAEQEGVRGPRNVKTVAMPLWSSSTKRRLSRPSIFQMPGPRHGASPSGSHSLGAHGGGWLVLAVTVSGTQTFSVGRNQSQLQGQLPGAVFSIIQEEVPVLTPFY